MGLAQNLQDVSFRVKSTSKASVGQLDFQPALSKPQNGAVPRSSLHLALAAAAPPLGSLDLSWRLARATKTRGGAKRSGVIKITFMRRVSDQKSKDYA